MISSLHGLTGNSRIGAPGRIAGAFVECREFSCQGLYGGPKWGRLGVFCLPKFAGAAGKLEEVRIVTTYNPGGMANAMQTALNMSLRERKPQHSAFLSRIEKHSVRWWHRSFLKVLDSQRLEATA